MVFFDMIRHKLFRERMFSPYGHVLRVRACEIIGLVVLLGLSCQLAGAEQWPGWRGLSREGRSESNRGPTHWSADKNVLWKTPIPGEGHSSPVVSEDAVFVTTAYMTPTDKNIRLWANLAVFAGILALVGFAASFLVRSCRDLPGGVRGVVQLASSTGFVLAVMILAGLVLIAEERFSFEREGVGKWLVSVVFVSLCVLLSALFTRGRGRARLVVGIISILFAVFVASHMAIQAPAAWSPGTVKLRPAVAVLPGLIGIVLLLSHWLGAGAGDPGKETGRLRRRLPGMVKWLAVVCGLFVLAAACAWVVHQDKAHEGQPLHEPVLPWWTLGIAGAVLATAVVVRRTLGNAFWANLLVQVAALPFAFLLVGQLAERLAASSVYLSYHLDSPAVTLTLGWLGVAALGVFSLVSIVALAVLESRRQRGGGAGLSVLFRCALLVAGALYFVSANYVSTKAAYVRAIVCLDRRSGDIRWIWEGLPGAKQRLHTENSSATPTPVIDGRRVYAYFGSPGLVCCDYTGKLLWINEDLPHDTAYGAVTSPILYGERVIVVSESRTRKSAGYGYIAAIDGRTGKMVYKTRRSKKLFGRNGIHRTPVVKEINGRKVILVWGRKDLTAHDPLTGEELWTFACKSLGSSSPVVTLVSDGKKLYLAGTRAVAALEMDKLGTASDPVVWRTKVSGPDCSSPVLANGLLFMVSDRGKVTCLRSTDGEEVWKMRLKGTHYPSPVAIGSRVYFCSNRGRTTVVDCQGSPQIVADNPLNEGISSSFAPVDGQLFIRTVNHLYCVQESTSVVDPSHASSSLSRH